MSFNQKYPSIPPSGIGEAAKYNFSPRYIKLRFQDKSPLEGRKWKEATKPVSSLQTTIGNEFEDRVYQYLEDNVREHISDWYDWDDKRNEEQLLDVVRDYNNNNYDDPTMLTQVRLSGKIEFFEVSGDSDLIIVSCKNDEVIIHVMDIKSSWDEKPSQQLQTATYTNLVRQILKTEDDINYDIRGGILYRETELDNVLKIDKSPNFNIETREGDVKRVLRENGPFKRAFDNEFDELPLTVNKNSPYSEVSVVEAIESLDLSLLGLSGGEKKKLESFGINNLEDMAMLYEPIEDPKPFEYEDPPRNSSMQDLVLDVKENVGLSERLSVLSQKAQAILGELNPESDYAYDKPWMPWIIGSGDGRLPEDDPPYDTDLPIERGSMIRVYLDIQHDHVRDEVVALSGVVSSGQYDGEPLEFSEIISDINRDPNSWRSDAEKDLLERGITQMYNTIEFLSEFAGHNKNTPIHFYVYSENEYDKLYESVERHSSSSKIVNSMRYLLDHREGIDQPMFSILEPEIEDRMAIKDMDTSLVSILDRFYPQNDDHKVEDSDWIIQDEDGNSIDLREAYEFGLFDTYQPITYAEIDNSPKVLNTNKNNTDPDSFYKVVPRRSAQIPIEYLWASSDINEFDTSWTDDSRQQSIIESYMWVNRDEKNIRMKSELFRSMSRIFSKALHHIERSISYRNTDIEKQSVDISKLTNLQPEKTELSQACLEYLDLESKQTELDSFDIYSKNLDERILDGSSVPITVTNILRDEGYMFKLEGELLFDKFSFENPDKIARSSKINGSDSMTGGSRCVATPIVNDKDGYKIAADSPRQVANSTKVSVDEYDPKNSRIVISGYRAGYNKEFRYVRNRIPWTLDGSELGKQYIGPGESFILDPSPDNMMAEKSIKSLKNARRNPVYRDIQSIKDGNEIDMDSVFSSENCQSYFEWVQPAVDFKPNPRQKQYIENVNKYSLLQGPPGTGKTSGALAHTVLARAYDMDEKDERLTGLVTGLSNKSVDEVMYDVENLLSNIHSNIDGDKLKNLRLIRLSYNTPEQESDLIEYMNYRDEGDIEKLRNIIKSKNKTRQASLGTRQAEEHTIVFATPGRVDGLVGELDEERDANKLYEDADDLFNLLAIDEASMMPMYQYFMTTPFVTDDSQILICGDHRQLPPVQKYDWNEEKRKTIQDNLPHLSVLDYYRYLRGDNVRAVYDNSPESPSIDIPITRLNRTYRCHKTVTKFLRQAVYRKDNINYASDIDDTIEIDNYTNESINSIFSPEHPITLIIHRDRKSRQVNSVEEAIISNIVSEVPNNYTQGIVTPHNAQKGRLKSSCSKCTVDTVERFQGGEKDVMFLSTTVSDPDFLSKEEEFILSENRLNVALSRMKKKLVVVAPESVFELVPDEIDIYDESTIWKTLYSVADATREPDWQGDVSDISSLDSNIEFSVYHIEDI